MNKTIWYDAVVIGGGVLGAFAARNLMRWNLSVLIIEAEDDVCKGITRANTAIVYTGYDNQAGSLKAQLTVESNRNFATLCADLDVPFSRCGSLLAAFDKEAEAVLYQKYENGLKNGVQGMQLLEKDALLKMEPMLSDDVLLGLYAPDTGTVNPWQLGIAACENALANGCRLMLNEPVQQIHKHAQGYLIETNSKKLYARSIINCAGLHADWIHNLVFAPEVFLTLDGADYLVLDKTAVKPKHIIFHEDKHGKGITAVPCTEGNLLLESRARALTAPFAATREGLCELKETAQLVLPRLDLTKTIRSFGAVRPNIRTVTGKNIPDFYLSNPSPDFFSMIGVKTPGLTCADALGRYVAEQIAAYLHAEVNPGFQPVRKGIPKGIPEDVVKEYNKENDTDRPECKDGTKSQALDTQIICQCEQITRGEILEAIRRGAATVDGVKRRTGAGMGRCQGSRCSYAIAQLLEEAKYETL